MTVLTYLFFSLLGVITSPMLLGAILSGAEDNNSFKSIFSLIWASIATIFFVGASFDMEDLFYFLLRLTMMMIMLGNLITEKHIFKLIPLFFLILYNPIIPVYLHDKNLWENWNIITAIYLWISFLRFLILSKKNKNRNFISQQ